MKATQVKVIHASNIPARLPIWATITGWLFFDRLNIPDWGWGVFWTMAALVWIGCIILVWKQERAHVKFEEEK